MEIDLIISAVWRNKVGAILIILQVALTTAVVSNALFLVQQQVRRIQRPTGIDEANVFSLTNWWGGAPQDLKSRLQTDLSAIRGLPGVIDAYATDGLPLSGGGYMSRVGLNPDDSVSSKVAALYPADEHGLQALGVHIVAGRWFNHGEVADWSDQLDSPDGQPVILLTQSLASKLFPRGDALGKTVYIDKNAASVIGIVERLQISSVNGPDGEIENSMITPYLWAESKSNYVVRTIPGTRDRTLKLVQKTLLEIDRTRLILHAQPFEETRAEAYRPFRAMVLTLSILGGVLLVVTALGVIGLTSYWVAQRRHQIGIRRALGARKIDILRYFHTENLLIVGLGASIGLTMAVGTNLLMIQYLEMSRMPATFLVVAGLIMLAVGQIGVIWPALRGAAVSPATATRA